MNVLRTLLFAVVVPGGVLLYLPVRIGTGSGWTVDLGPLRWAGPFFMGVGTLLYFWCALDFSNERPVPASADEATPRLVVQGPYHFVRNPMYIGGLLVLVGHGLWFQAPALLPYVALVFVAFHLFVVFYEEPAMRRRFGDEYRVYSLAVPRWIPRWPEMEEQR
jgi:protein-S-isoprenylcysteine O-methyltransferase Ste14